MNYSWYITPEEYEIAKNNGIRRHTLEGRIRHYGWPKKKAINTPTRKINKWPKNLKEILKQNNIGYHTFLARIYNLGWDFKKASTTPVMNIQDLGKMLDRLNRKYPIEYIKLAEKNGINAATFRVRINRLGWPMDKAAMAPTRKYGSKKGGKEVEI